MTQHTPIHEQPLPAGSTHGSSPELRTAPVRGHVLGGIARQLVVECAQQLGLPVIEQAPNLKDSHQWQEAFVCSWCG